MRAGDDLKPSRPPHMAPLNVHAQGVRHLRLERSISDQSLSYVARMLCCYLDTVGSTRLKCSCSQKRSHPLHWRRGGPPPLLTSTSPRPLSSVG